MAGRPDKVTLAGGGFDPTRGLARRVGPGSMDEAQVAPRSILLVDDDERLVRSLARRLRLDGYEVSGVSSGSAALGTLAERRYGAVVFDMCLRDMSADEFLE